MKKPQYNLFKAYNGQWYFNLQAPNGKIILSSEGYKRKTNALKTIVAIHEYSGAKIHLIE